MDIMNKRSSGIYLLGYLEVYIYKLKIIEYFPIAFAKKILNFFGHACLVMHMIIWFNLKIWDLGEHGFS